MSDSSSSNQELPDFDRVKTIARDMFTTALGEYPPILAVAAIEQLRASIRDHLMSIECDPLNQQQLRAFTLGALFTIYRQGQYTPIGMETSIVPAITLDMIDTPIDESTMLTYDHIVEMFGEEQSEENEDETTQSTREPVLIAGLRHALKLWDARKKH